VKKFIVILIFIACNSKRENSEAILSDSTSQIKVPKTDVDTIIISERIDGPANIRDTISGRLLFSLNDNIPVEATKPKNKWLQVGILADLTQKQKDSLIILRGSSLFINGKVSGQTIEDVHLRGAFNSKDGLKGELVGYTSASNIRERTIPENIFSAIINSDTGSLKKTNFTKFLKDFQFNDYDGLLPEFKGYEIDENWIDDPSPLLRLRLLFKGDKLYGVFHARDLNLNSAITIKVKCGFYFSTFSQDDKINKELVNSFNEFITSVD